MTRLRVAVLMGGPSSEHDVSLASGANVLKHLSSKKYQATPVRISRENRWYFPRQRPISVLRGIERLRRFDIVLLALHGQFGEDGVLQALLEANRVPFTGSGSTAAAVAMDKGMSNLVFTAVGLTVPEWSVISKDDDRPRLRFPLVVKPVSAGSSVDTFIVHTPAEYRRAAAAVTRKHGHVLVQKFVRGRELTCGIVDDRRGRPQALPPTEIRPKTSSWFDYRAKYTMGGSEEVTPAPLTAEQTRTVQRLALRAHEALHCRGMSRSDFIFDGRLFWILETNTIPGLTPTSLLPQSAAAAGLSFSGLLDRIIAAGVRRTA